MHPHDWQQYERRKDHHREGTAAYGKEGDEDSECRPFAAEPGQADESPYREMTQGYLDWVNQFYANVYAVMGGTPDPLKDPSGTVDGCYYNYPDIVLGTHEDKRIDQAMWLYFLDNFRNNERNLVGVKRYWDPENYFHHPQSIPLDSPEK